MTDLQKTIDDLNLMNALCHGTVLDDAIALLKDRQEIVRCKDCKHGEPCNDGEIYCEKDIGTIVTAVHKPDWFCADGERKSD